MDDPRLIVAILVIVVVIAVVIWSQLRRHRRERLQGRFGPEYGQAVHKYGSVTEAESALEEREARVRRMPIRPLDIGEARQFAAAWRGAQARFVDDPMTAVAEADDLVQDVMHRRGYPVGEFEQRVADISVDHAPVAEHYRAAHEVALATRRGETNTEDLRQAMKHYRALFEDLLEVRDEAPRRMEA